jgi:putative transposase
MNLCHQVGVKRSTYYNWKNGKSKKENDEFAVDLIKTVFEDKKKKAGIRTIKMIIERDCKLIINLKKISRIKNQYGLETQIRRKNKFRYIAKGGEEHIVSPNILNRQFEVQKKDHIFSTDITYLEYGTGLRAYMSAVKDLGTKEIVNHTVSKNINMDIVIKGLDDLFKPIPSERRKSLIMHSDQGTHYTHEIFRNKLSEYGVKQSMSRRGNCLDNAPIESFFGHMKDELDLKSCKTYDELVIAVDNFVNYYNFERPQWCLKRKTPAECRGLLNF